MLFGKVCVLKFYLLNSKDVGNTLHSLLKTSLLSKGDYLLCVPKHFMYDKMAELSFRAVVLLCFGRQGAVPGSETLKL